MMIMSKQDFEKAINDIHTNVLSVVERTGISKIHNYFVVKFSDIEFRAQDYKGEVKRWYIINSKNNRRPSVQPNSRKLPKKIEYLLRVFANVASFNFFPVGMIPGSSCLEGEDRGHAATLLFCHFDTKFDVEVWKKVCKIMEDYINDEYRSNEWLNNIYNRIIELRKDPKCKKDGFSMKEVIPQEVLDNWMETATIAVQVKAYPNRDMHIREIIGINNTEDTWIEHQKALHSIYPILSRLKVDVHTFFDSIFSLVDGNDYFIGNKKFFGAHSAVTDKAENAEEEILWLWVTSNALTNEISEDRYKKFYTKDAKKRQEQYGKALIKPNMRDIKHWRKQTEFLTAIAASEAYNDYQDKIDDLVRKYLSQDKTHTNIRDLSIRKVDTALMFCEIIRWHQEKYHTDSKENTIQSAARIFEVAEELLNDRDVLDNLLSAKASFGGRYSNFFTPLIEKLKKKPIGDIRDQLLSTARARLKSTTLNPHIPFKIIDRTGEGKDSFTIVTVSLETGKGFDMGHKDSKFDNTDINNFFLQFSGDNRFWSNKRGFEPTEYAKEYIGEIKQWYDSDDDSHIEAYNNTRLFVMNVWK